MKTTTQKRKQRGFTLVEVSLVAGVAALLVSMAWPSQKAQLQRARRGDAVAALMRVQFAQEQYRAHHGLYAPALSVLVGAAAPKSPEGYYDIVVSEAVGESVTIAASARADGAQSGDAECAQLTLSLNQGMADFGPSARCWNR